MKRKAAEAHGELSGEQKSGIATDDKRLKKGVHRG